MTTLHLTDAFRLLRESAFFRPIEDEPLQLLAGQAERVSLVAGQILVKQGDRGDGLYVIDSGTLKATVRGRGEDVELARLGRGETVGEIQLVVGGPRSATVEALTDSTVLRLPHTAFAQLAQQVSLAFAAATTHIRRRLLSNQLAPVLTKVFGALDPAVVTEIEHHVEWVSLACGQALFQQGDPCDGWYLLLSGRLRVVTRDEATGAETAVSELGSGESLGEMALLSGEPRNATPYAVRDCLLVRFPVRAFEQIMARHPQVLLSISRTVIKRSHRVERKASPSRKRIFVVVPHRSGPAAGHFSHALLRGLSRLGTALLVNQQHVAETGILGEHPSRLAADHPNWGRLATWLEEQHLAHDFLVVEASAEPGEWTERIIGQADHIVLVADVAESPQPGWVEAKLLSDRSPALRRAVRTLVLVHPSECRLPSGTAAWLSRRAVDGHCHVHAHSQDDADRVARLIADRSIGLVLGGGGARGYAHIGVVRVLRELGIPIDRVGGTSIGAILGGQVASGLDHDAMVDLNHRCVALDALREYTIPMVALLKSARIAQAAELAFGGARIEDLWLPYFAVSADIVAMEMVVHETGSIAEATRASGAVPGIVVPVVKGKQLLIDGGIVNNLPADLMRERCGGGTVIAVDASVDDKVALSPDGIPSQWRLFLNRTLPFQKRLESPSIVDVLTRATMLASTHRLAEVRRQVDYFLRPPIDASVGMLEFEKMDGIIEAGYRYALPAVRAWNLTSGGPILAGA